MAMTTSKAVPEMPVALEATFTGVRLSAVVPLPICNVLAWMMLVSSELFRLKAWFAVSGA